MPSEALAPKLSVLQKAFSTKDLTVVALYMKTCGGVPDHAAEIARQVAKHKIDYPVLDVEGGPIDDPTFKRFSWAPHALVVDNTGRVLRTYGQIPSMKTLREDLAALVATRLFAPRPGDGWREFPRYAWVEVRIEGRGAPRTEKRTLKKVSRDSVTIQRGTHETKLFRKHPVDREHRRTEHAPEALSIDRREVVAQVFEATWKRNKVLFAERSWVADRMLLRRETIETSPGGSRIERTYRLLKWNDPVSIGGREIGCRVVERTATWKTGRSVEQVWISQEVPGREVKRVVRTVTKGESSTETSRVVAFGLR